MLRISVSDLESLRWWKNDEDSTKEELIARLSHKEPPNTAMLVGHAFATMMETIRCADIESVEVEGWSFFFELEDEMPISPVRELKAEMVFQTRVGPVTLVGKVDGLNGLEVRDQKLSSRWDAEKYFDSLQWKAYLMMFKAVRFVYDVFVGKINEAAKEVIVTEYHLLTFWRYPEMEADVQRAVEELAEIIHEHMPAMEAETTRQAARP